jgi:PilZ domain-containing protein
VRFCRFAGNDLLLLLSRGGGRTLEYHLRRVKPAWKKLLVGESIVEARSLFRTGPNQDFMDARRHPRFKVEVPIRVYPRDCPVVRGDTVDLSESGISAMLRIEIPVGEVVRLEFSLPPGEVEVLAMVRQRNAFRYGLQFVETGLAKEIIGRACSQLAMKQRGREYELESESSRSSS